VKHFLVHYGAVAVLVGAAVEGDASLLLAGVVAHLGRMPLLLAIAAGWVGSFASDCFWYSIGRRHAERVLRSPLYQRVRPLVEGIAVRVGAGEIVVARFVYGSRIVSMLFWGVHGLPFPRFAVLDAIGCGLAVTTLATLGFVLSGSIETLLGRVRRVEVWLGVALLLSVGAVALMKRAARRVPEDGHVA